MVLANLVKHITYYNSKLNLGILSLDPRGSLQKKKHHSGFQSAEITNDYLKFVSKLAVRVSLPFFDNQQDCF